MGSTFTKEEIDQENGIAMKKWLADTKDARKLDPVCNLNNISEYEKMRRKQLVEIFLGICFLHWWSFTHNDINLSSIMCGKKDGKCRITGMGQSLRYSMRERENKMCDHDRAGQPKFRSPEANYVREHWGNPVDEQAVHLEHTRFFNAEANDIWSFKFTVAMFMLMSNMAPYTEQSVVDSEFHYVTEGRFLKAEQWKIIQKRVNEASKMKPKRRKYIITDCDENDIADLKKGIAKVVQKNARLRKQYVVPITAECVDVMHRGFMPEARKPSAAELLWDPYFESDLKEKIQEMQEWQSKNCDGNCDDIYKNLLDQAKEDRARKSSHTNYEYSEKDKRSKSIEKEIHQALVRLGKPTDRESISKYYYVKPVNTLYVLPDEVRTAAFEYIEHGEDGYRLALLNTKKVIDAMKMNLDRDWEEFRLTVLREIISRKEDCTIDNFDTGQEYKCFQAQLQINLACCERYLVRAVVPQWDDYASAESAMFSNVFGSSSLPWNKDRYIPYRLHPFLQSVKRPIPGAPAWYIQEKSWIYDTVIKAQYINLLVLGLLMILTYRPFCKIYERFRGYLEVILPRTVGMGSRLIIQCNTAEVFIDNSFHF